MKGSGLTWDAKTLDQFLAAPTKKVPGTKMPISVSDPAKRDEFLASPWSDGQEPTMKR